jgi:hypothetical protein
MKKILLLSCFLVLYTTFSFGNQTEEQLKKSGYSSVLGALEESKEKNVRFRSIYPDNTEKTREADKLYGSDYVIKDIADVKDMYKDRVIMYYPGVIGNSMMGLTGLTNTIRADSLKKGSYAIGGKYVYSKIQRKNGDDIDFADGEKAEVSSFYVTAAMGVTNNFEIGYSLPVHSFQIKQADLYPYDMDDSGVGDVALRAKFSFPFGNEGGYAGLGFGVKLPSGNDEKMSPAGVTGEPDIEIIGMASSKFGLINGHVNLIYAFTGNSDTPGTPFTYNDNKFTFNVGLDYSKSDFVTLMLEINAEDWGAYGNRADFVPGVRGRIVDKFNGEIAFPITIHNSQYYGYKFKMIMGLSYQF